MAEVRKRVAVKHEPTATASCSQTGESEATEVVNHQQKSDVQTSHGSQSQRHLIVSWLVITIASAAALGTAAYYVGRSKGLERAGPSPVPRHMSSSQLAKYNGFDDPRMLLSILGQVFDVTSGKSYYEPGTPYYFFIARDASSVFVADNFDNAAASPQPHRVDHLSSTEVWCDDLISKARVHPPMHASPTHTHNGPHALMHP
eukprot:m.120946 g.120946  ORF g.120946 m.120946 type:complete len:202 (+) comp13696_c0_seq3:58-663(+)